MILILESGSTKCDSVMIEESGTEVCRFSSMGFNPFFHSAEVVEQELKKLPEVIKYSGGIRQVHFYGAGCSSDELRDIIARGLRNVFTHAEVNVEHDLAACAYSTYSGDPAISCILGTGSNSVYFDGKNIREEVPALAYILGDEGSASYIGKKIVSSYFYKKMPEDAASDFKQTYGLEKDDMLKRVYNQPYANVYLASFAPFAQKHIGHPFFWEMVFNGFRSFLDIHVMCYPEAAKVPVHFVGSVAWYFQDVLKQAIEHMDLKMGNIVQKPLDGLVQYHLRF